MDRINIDVTIKGLDMEDTFKILRASKDNVMVISKIDMGNIIELLQTIIDNKPMTPSDIKMAKQTLDILC